MSTITPTCSTAAIRNAIVHTPMPGSPATRKPRPARVDWINATPRIPLVTLRIVAPINCWNSAPEAPKRRLHKEEVTLYALSAFARRIPATTMERANCSTVRPNPLETESNPGTAALIYGARFLTTSLTFLDARLHALFNRAPMIGQFSIPAGGGGIVTVPSLKWDAAV